MTLKDELFGKHYFITIIEMKAKKKKAATLLRVANIKLLIYIPDRYLLVNSSN